MICYKKRKIIIKKKVIIYDYEYMVTEDEGYKYNKFEGIKNFDFYPPTSLFIALLKNSNFRKRFSSIYEEYANNVMAMDKVEPIIEEYFDEMPDLFSFSLASHLIPSILR